MRGRPTGAVIVDICRDLGIDTSHELWPELRDAIIEFGGSLAHMLRAWTNQLASLLAGYENETFVLPLPNWDEPHPASTGPP